MRRLTTPRWIARHLLAIGLVTSFLALGWWQVGRAAAGNTLSYGYAFEWPVFAGFVIFVWVREMRRDPDTAATPVSSAAVSSAPVGMAPGPVPARLVADNPAYADDDDAALAAYNAYLQWLTDNPGARPADYPLRRA